MVAELGIFQMGDAGWPHQRHQRPLAESFIDLAPDDFAKPLLDRRQTCNAAKTPS
jgi:hypothetical protein